MRKFCNISVLFVFGTTLSISAQSYCVGGEEFFDDFSSIDNSRKNWTSSCDLARYIDGCVLLDAVNESNAVSITLLPFSQRKIETFSCRLKFTASNGHAGVRFVGKNGNGLFIFVDDGGKLLGWIGHGPMECKKINLAKNAWALLEISVHNDIVDLCLNGQKLATLSKYTPLPCDVELRAGKSAACFDDVKIKFQPRSAKPVKPNIINNSSFENAGSANMPDYWGFGSWGLTDDSWIGRMNELWHLWRRDMQNPVDGKYCMRVGGIPVLHSTSVYPRSGVPYMLSAYMKASGNNKSVEVGVTTYPGWENHFSETAKLETSWKRYTFKIPPMMQPEAFIRFVGKDGTTFWVDAVQMEEGLSAGPYRPDGSSVQELSDDDIRATLPTVKIGKSGTPVKIDGNLDEQIWSEENFFPLSLASGGKPENPTKVAMAYDNEKIYIAYRCHEKDFNSLIGKVKARDGFVWDDDCVEWFFSTEDGGKDYYHFGVSNTGAKYDALKTDPAWSIDWDAAVKKEKDHWDVEIAIPFNSLSMSEAALGPWRINFCREKPQPRELSSWSATHGSFHNSKRFGIISPLPHEVLLPWIKSSPTVSMTQVSKIESVNFMKVGNAPVIGFGLAWQSVYEPGEKTFAVMKKNGFNSINYAMDLGRCSVESQQKVLDLAEKNGIKVICWIIGCGGEPSAKSLEAVKKTIQTFKHHPAVVAWMVLDEPHSQPKIVKRAYELGKKLDPSRPSFINLTPTGLSMRIAGVIGDIVSFDIYAFRFNSDTIADIPQVAAKAYKEARNGSRPAIAFLQGMGHAYWVYDGPSPDEMSAQTYAAITNGVTGVYYFCGFPFPVDTYDRMKRLASELKQLSPVILSGTPLAVSADNSGIGSILRRYDGNLYLVIVNASYNLKKFNCSFPEVQTKTLKCNLVYGTGNSLGRYVDGKFTDSLEPLAYRVYRLEGK